MLLARIRLAIFADTEELDVGVRVFVSKMDSARAEELRSNVDADAPTWRIIGANWKLLRPEEIVVQLTEGFIMDWRPTSAQSCFKIPIAPTFPWEKLSRLRVAGTRWQH